MWVSWADTVLLEPIVRATWRKRSGSEEMATRIRIIMLLVFALLPFLVNGFTKQLPLGASPLQHSGALRNAPPLLP